MPLPDNICLVQFSEELETTQNSSELTRTYNCKGFESAHAAEAALSPHLPAFASNSGATMPVVSIATKLTGDSHRLNRALLPGEGEFVYRTNVKWSTHGLDGSKERWSIESGNEQKHLNYALQRIFSQHISGAAAPSHNGAINVQRTSEGWDIQGVDIPPAGDFTYTIEKSYITGTTTIGTLRSIFAYKYRVNSNTWRGFAPGEVCFKGCRISNDIAERREVMTYEFEISADTTPFVPPFGPTYATGKRGWDYFWVQYEEASDSNGSFLRPRAWYIDRIMPFVSFAGLDTLIG